MNPGKLCLFAGVVHTSGGSRRQASEVTIGHVVALKMYVTLGFTPRNLHTKYMKDPTSVMTKTGNPHQLCVRPVAFGEIVGGHVLFKQTLY